MIDVPFIDPQFAKLTLQQKAMVIVVPFCYLLIAGLSFMLGLTSLFESFLLVALGVVSGDVMRLDYRLKRIERKNRK